MDITAVAIVGIIFGCGTGVLTKFMDTISGSRVRAREQELRLKEHEALAAQDRIRLLETQVIEARRENESLRKQMEWHAKLLETQDQMMRRLLPGTPAPQNGAGAAPTVPHTPTSAHVG